VGLARGGRSNAAGVPVGSFGSSSAEDAWSGTWSTNFNEMRLTQTGSRVEGKYDYDDGHLTGTVTGNTLEGRWDAAPSRKGADAGPFKFTMGESGRSSTGTWRHESNPTEALGSWNGTCTGGPCLQNGELEQTGFTFRFAAGARHPANILSPLRRREGWNVGARSFGKIVTMSYLDGKDILTWGIDARFEIVGQQLRTSGPAKVLKLDLRLTELSATLNSRDNKCRSAGRG